MGLTFGSQKMLGLTKLWGLKKSLVQKHIGSKQMLGLIFWGMSKYTMIELRPFSEKDQFLRIFFKSQNLGLILSKN